MNRWAEYDAGKLTPPCIVQHDQIRDEHLIWVWDGVIIHGPISRTSFDEKDILETVEALKQMALMPVEPIQDAKDIEIATLKEELAQVSQRVAIAEQDADFFRKENDGLKADLAVAVAAVAVSEKMEEPLEKETP